MQLRQVLSTQSQVVNHFMQFKQVGSIPLLNTIVDSDTLMGLR